jgi:uncharacterized membrane protein YtjA (UPF0391 family)
VPELLEVRVIETPLEYGEELFMLRYALLFFVISLIAGLFGFTGISAATAGIARICFFIAVVVFLAFLVLSLFAGSAIL